MTQCVCVCVFQDVTPLQIVFPDTALRLQALLDFEEVRGQKRVAGDEWLFEGPGGVQHTLLNMKYINLIILQNKEIFCSVSLT